MKTKLGKSTLVYLLTLAVIILACIYPLVAGGKVIAAYARFGHVEADSYPKYLIPYTPVALALILTVALMPLSYRYLKKFSLPALSLLGTGSFLTAELLMEQITVFAVENDAGTVGTWQLFLCYITPEVRQTIEYQSTIGNELVKRYNPAFKLHFYLIALLMVLAVLATAHGLYKMHKTGRFEKRRPLIIQGVSTAVFVGLCIFACFTAFYRTGDINISALSARLMSTFFIVFGVTAGTCVGGLMYGKRPLLSLWLPSVVALITASAMYAGEMVLLGGKLFRFGHGFLFAPIGTLVLAPVDLFVILLSAVATFAVLRFLGRVHKRER